MKIVVPSVEIMYSGLEKDVILPEQHIEKVGRTCYKSEDKMTEDSAAKFVSGLIKRGHEAVIEHWTYIFKTDLMWYEQIVEDYEMLLNNRDIRLNEHIGPFLRFTDQKVDSSGTTRCVISGNIRAWRDYTKACLDGFGFVPGYLHGMIKNNPLFFPEYQTWVPVSINNTILKPISVNELVGDDEHLKHHDVTVRFTCDRGVSHEIVRHRTSSFAQESTRYCNYSNDKFNNEITVVRPSWCNDLDSYIGKAWEQACMRSEADYFLMLDLGATPQEARSTLNNSLKTELVMTTNLEGWGHFFHLRCAKDAHPDIREVAWMARRLFDREGLMYRA